MEPLDESTLFQLADRLAELTCEISKKCSEKEKHLADKLNLTTAEFKCLRLFTKKPEIPIKDISDKMKITQGRVTQIITSLEYKSMIYRKLDPADKRNVIVCLTTKSKPFLNAVKKMYIRMQYEIIQNMDPEKRDYVFEMLEDIIKTLSQRNEEISVIE